MAVKTITITVAAYEALVSLKGEKDSFSDVILENFRPKRSPLWELVGIMSKESADELERNILANRKRHRESSAKRYKAIADALSGKT